MEEDKIKQQAEQIIEKIKALVKDGNASHVTLKRKGETLLSVSMNAGIIGAVIGLKAAPFLVLTAALVSFGLDCEIEIEKKDGTIVNLNETRMGVKLEEIKETAKDKAKDIFGEGYDVSATVDAEEAEAEVVDAEGTAEEQPDAQDEADE
ncbi:MAG: DUF4342 domain-containing protein [Clostridia bacterium]|nr:DUF4342 domain-containing protein [Clostridia bacterium]